MRNLSLAAAIWALSLLGAQAQPPCNNILPLTCGSGNPVTATLSGTGNWANNTGCLYPTPGNEQLYSFTAPITGYYEIVVTSTNFEWIDYFFKPASGGCTNSGWTCIDDVIGTGTTPGFNLTAGTTYYFLLDAEDDAFPATHTFYITCGVPAAADPCTNIQTITCGTPVTASVSGPGTWANNTGCLYTTPGAEQIFSFTPTVSGAYTLNVTATNSQWLDYFYKEASGGCSDLGWTCIDDVISPGLVTPSLNLTAGTTYYILVDAEVVGTATHTFTLECPAPPPVDPCTNVLNIAACGTNVSLTLPAGTGLWNLAACTGSTPGREQLYTFTPTATGNYQLSSSANTNPASYFIKPVSAGCDDLNWTCIGTNNFGGNIGTPVAMTAGTQYYIFVDATTTNITTQTFQIQCLPPDPCQNIQTLTCGTPTTFALTSGNGMFSNNFCGYTVSGREMIYSFTAPGTGQYELNITATNSQWVDYGFKEASQGCADGGFTCIDDIFSPGLTPTFLLTGGTTYYILADAEGTGGASQTFEIRAVGTTTVSYTGSPFCQSGTNPTPTVTGLTGGTFSSTAGLSINPTTGEINLAASSLGTYTVTYTTGCNAPATATVEITAAGSGAFAYAASNFCTSGANPSPTVTGLPGGTFSSGTGLSLNSATGEIDLAASTPGTYTVTYTTPGACPGIGTQTVIIESPEDASFGYPAASFCQLSANPSPTITGATGGSFGAPAGLVINNVTGEIDLLASTLGTYTVTYTTAGSCPGSSAVQVALTGPDDVTFAYAAQSFCLNELNPAPIVTGVQGGSFSSTPGLSLNPATGEIDLAASSAGVYTVTYATTGDCGNSGSVQVTLIDVDVATLSYGAASFCDTLPNPTPTLTGVTGGTFSSTAGLALNATTGEVDLAASTAGTYTITYTTPGICPTSADATLTVMDCAVGRLDATLASALRIYPNPVTASEVFVDANVNGELALSLTDLHGRSLHTEMVQATQGGTLRIALPSLAAGTYLLRLSGSGTSSTFHLVVVR